MVQKNKQSGQENRVRMAIWDQKAYVVWQWEGDEENDWIPYPAATCLDLQAAKNGDRDPTVDLTFGQVCYKLDTTRMLQRNEQTKFERPIECKEAVATKPDDGSQLDSGDLDAGTSVRPAKKAQTEPEASTSQGKGDEKAAEEGSQLASGDLDASTSVPAEKPPTEPEASTSQAKGEKMEASAAEEGSQLVSGDLDASTSVPAEKPQAEPEASTSQMEGEKMAAEEGSQLASGDLDASASVPAEEPQAEPEASTSQGKGNAAEEESQLDSGDLDASTSVLAQTPQAEPEASTSLGKEDLMEAVKSLKMKGIAPVDPECEAKVGKAHVYCDAEDTYDVMLNQTNLQFNNNKYYVIQLLEEDNPQSYSVWMRWGRVGKPGQHTLIPCFGDLAKAKEIFTKKFLDKTKNEWSNRANFQKVSGKYDLLHLDYEVKDDSNPEAAPEATVSKPKPVSQLDLRVQALIELICNIQTMEEMVTEMKYDTRKAPLGKLTAEQIRAGYQSLQKVEDCLKHNLAASSLLEACNEFYTRIPHDFGLRTPPVIKTLKELHEKVQLLEALNEVRIGIKHVQLEQLDLEHPLDRSYRSLDCELLPLEKTSDIFKVLERYLLSTHAPTHKTYKMTLIEAFEVNKKCLEAGFRFDLPNRMLLWHGSRLGNWAGILSQGLRVAPPEAPVTGYMFGKGIYFADMSSKSANYCFATRDKDVGFLLLSEVALGECNELVDANPEAEKLLLGKHSTKGLGKLVPSDCISLHGATVPMGPAKETGVVNPNGYTLNYNEFVIYDPHQVRMKYLLKVRFNFKPLR
ncbi:poly [ADP-ribose] polymerase 2 isoform X2 [Thamnophis elegans]|uniref:poly [ADP-ribose] polymerase 2 isoform X2 n=1 Tax=Thamnophis elegans TaxID=35005 RepID=UPI0013771F15|nr:poly [ADP-ribose] polymerase 2 isoform X2 [Thamnophis elegans]